MELKLTRDELQRYLADVFPQTADDYAIEALAPMRLTVRAPIDHRHLRPGGTVSGPTMFALADCSVYMAVLSMIGRVPLAVTTGGSVDFMRKPADGKDLLAECRLLKLGRTLAVGDVLIHSDGVEDAVARATLTYAIPNGSLPDQA